MKKKLKFALVLNFHRLCLRGFPLLLNAANYILRWHFKSFGALFFKKETLFMSLATGEY
jgi:hypothetical protein